MVTETFRTAEGTTIPGVSPEQLQELLGRLVQEVGITPLQSVEAAGFSIAMVIRVALGLSAEGARVAVAYSDTFSGWAALSCARHLINGGGSCPLIPLEEKQRHSQTLTQLLQPLSMISDEFIDPALTKRQEDLHPLLSDVHALLIGSFDVPSALHKGSGEFFHLVNEMQTPVHCVMAPAGLDALSGERLKEPLFASSTVSLGAPLCGLLNANEFVGRHYIADISVPRGLYSTIVGRPIRSLFSSQPVVQLFPVQNDAKTE